MSRIASQKAETRRNITTAGLLTGLLCALALACACITAPAPAFAETTIVSYGTCGQTADNDGQDVVWKLDSEGTLTICLADGVTGTRQMKDFAIQELTPWETNHYRNNTSVKKVVVEEGIQHLGQYAFQNCVALTDVVLANSVTTIYNYAFKNCTSLRNVAFSKQLNYIGSHAFNGCTSLASIELPDSLKTIDRYAFYGCNLTSVTFYGALPSCGPYAFEISGYCVVRYYTVFSSDFNGEWATNVGMVNTTFETIDPYGIVYKDEGGADFSGTLSAGAPTEHVYGKATSLVDAARDGYAFKGWYTDSSCSSASKVTELGAYAYSGDYGNITLYAKWEAVYCTVSFDANGGGGTMDPVKVLSGSSYTVPVCAFTSPSNHTFTGWNTLAVPTVEDDGNAYAVGSTIAVTADTTLYAQWEEDKKYTVSFDTGGGSAVGSVEKYKNDLIGLGSLAPTWQCHTLVGWSDGSHTYAPNASYEVEGDVTLRAVWEESHTGGTATCAAAAVCEECGESYGEKDASNHVGGTVVRGAKEATSDEEGYTGDTYCRGCGAMLAEGEAIPALGPEVDPRMHYFADTPRVEGGSVTVSPNPAAAGDVVTVVVTAAKGYECTGVSVAMCGDGSAVEVTANADGTYSYTQPEGKVTVTPGFGKQGSGTAEPTDPTEPTTPTDPTEPTTPSEPTTDEPETPAADKAAQRIVGGKKAFTAKAKKATGKLAKKKAFRIGCRAKYEPKAATLTYGLKKVTVKKAGGTYKKASKKIRKLVKVGKTGKVTLKKGLPKGTYKVKVRVKAKATASHAAATKVKTIKIRVK